MASLLALFSSVVWGTADFLGGVMSRRRLPFAVIGGSQIAGTFLVIAFAVGFGHWDTSNQHVMVWGVSAGLLGLIGLTAFYAALSSGLMGIVSPVTSIGVVIPLFIGLLRGDQPSSVQYVGIIIAVIGVVLASGPELSSKATTRPIILSLIAAVSFGFCVFFMAQGGHSGNPAMTVVYMRVTQVCIVLLFAFYKKTNGGLTSSDIPMLFLIGITDAGANILFTFASTDGLLSIVSVLGSLYPVVTVILAWMFLKERLLFIQYIGITATIVGVVAITAG